MRKKFPDRRTDREKLAVVLVPLGSSVGLARARGVVQASYCATAPTKPNHPDARPCRFYLCISHSSRADDAVIRLYEAAGNVIETHEHAGEFEEP